MTFSLNKMRPLFLDMKDHNKNKMDFLFNYWMPPFLRPWGFCVDHMVLRKTFRFVLAAVNTASIMM